MNGGLVLAATIPALVAAVAIAGLRASPLAARILDRPNERSMHTVATPRVGGIGIAIAVAPFAVAHAGGSLAIAFACAAGLALLSLADDIRSLPAALRLAAHLLAAGIVAYAVASDARISRDGWVIAATALAIAWSANLFNFMDGADGLAGCMGAIGFATLAVAAGQAGAPMLAIGCAALASASVGFLLHNFPPARVFLGDAGSIPLGFLAGAIGWYGAAHEAWEPWFPVLVFSAFIVDASATLLIRLARGERLWVAHRDHGYQRLLRAGWSRRRLVFAAAALMLAAGVSALVARSQEPMVRCGIIFGWAATYGLLAFAIVVRTRKIPEPARK